MWKNGDIELFNPSAPSNIIEYIKSIDSLWFYITLLLIILTIISFTFNLVPARIIFGTLFLLFIPGYLLLEYLYPTGNFHSLEKIALSIGLSIVMVSLIGLIMNYTPAGILSIETILFMSIMDTILGVLVLIRKYRLIVSIKGGH